MAASVVGVAVPASAGQGDGSDPPAGWRGDAPSAQGGKPLLFAPPPPAPENATPCPPALPCGTRLYGTIRKNGAVELQVPALRW